MFDKPSRLSNLPNSKSQPQLPSRNLKSLRRNFPTLSNAVSVRGDHVVCSFPCHKECLSKHYKGPKNLWKGQPCPMESCEEEMLMVYLVDKDLEETVVRCLHKSKYIFSFNTSGPMRRSLLPRLLTDIPTGEQHGWIA